MPRTPKPRPSTSKAGTPNTRSPNWRPLTTDLHRTQITEAGIEKLLKRGDWDSIKNDLASFHVSVVRMQYKDETPWLQECPGDLEQRLETLASSLGKTLSEKKPR